MFNKDIEELYKYVNVGMRIVIYGDYLKTCVIKFRKDNNLSITDDIDSNFYKKLGITLFE